MPILQPQLKGGFSLDSSGIAGFFGGEEAFAAMNSVHLIPARRWMGWYNAPGSYFVAKKYGTLPNSTFWDGLFPGPPMEPAELLELDAKSGPRYTGVYSGTQLQTTGHLAYLISRHCKGFRDPESAVQTENSASAASTQRRHAGVASSDSQGRSPQSGGRDISDRNGEKPGHAKAADASSYAIPVSELPVSEPDQGQSRHRDISVTVVDLKDVKEWPEYPVVPEKFFRSLPRFGTLGIIFTIWLSLTFSALSALYGDWFSFSMILYGALANGITLLVLGKGVLCLDLTKPSKDSPPGDGVMWRGGDMVLLKGPERIVSTILHSRYRLRYETDPSYNKIGLCSILLLSQFLLQLFLIPQGILTGQVLFLSTLAASWICNGYLASFDREEMQTQLLYKVIGRSPVLYKFNVDKWTVAVAFAMFYFNFEDADPEGILNELMPNSTPAWNLWKQCMCKAIKYKCRPSEMIQVPGPIQQKDGISVAENLKSIFDNLPDKDRTFVRTFLQQADHGYNRVASAQSKVKKRVEEADAVFAQAAAAVTEVSKV